MLTAILLINLAVDGMIIIECKFVRIVNITSAAFKSPIHTLGLSNGAGPSFIRKIAVHNVTINNFLPGPFATDQFYPNVQIQAEGTGKRHLKRDWNTGIARILPTVRMIRKIW